MKIFCLVLVLILLMAGCSNTIVDAPTQDTSTQDELGDQGEPKQIIFDSGYEEIKDFMTILEKDDKEVEEYLVKHRYSWFDLETRKDVEAFFEMLSGTYFPVIEKASIEFIIIFPDWDDIAIRYNLIDGSTYNFRISTKPDTAEERIQQIRSEDESRLSENINKSAEDDIKIYYYTKDRNSEDRAEIFAMDVRGVDVGVRVFDAPDLATMTEVLQEVKFERLDDILKNLPPPVEKPTDRADVDETEGYTDEFGTFYLE